MKIDPDSGAMPPSEGDGSDVRLLFVYNADSGVLNALKDLVHKNVSPKTYQCNLCALTFINVGMRGDWEEFIDGLGYPVEFLHRDELRGRAGVDDVCLPAVLRKDPVGASVLIPAEEINDLSTLDELKGLVSIRVREMREATQGG